MAVECAPETQSLPDASLAAGLPHYHACAGRARCSTCRVLAIDGLESFGSRSPKEAELAALRRWPETVRLACQSRPAAPARVRRLVHDAINAGLAIGGAGGWPAAEEKRIGLLFCDISDFTTIVECQLAYDLVHSLNRFFKQLGDPIVANHGVINKSLGDGMLALFGLDSPTHDECARQRGGSENALLQSATTNRSHEGKMPVAECPPPILPMRTPSIASPAKTRRAETPY